MHVRLEIGAAMEPWCSCRRVRLFVSIRSSSLAALALERLSGPFAGTARADSIAGPPRMRSMDDFKEVAEKALFGE